MQRKGPAGCPGHGLDGEVVNRGLKSPSSVAVFYGTDPQGMHKPRPPRRVRETYLFPHEGLPEVTEAGQPSTSLKPFMKSQCHKRDLEQLGGLQVLMALGKLRSTWYGQLGEEIVSAALFDGCYKSCNLEIKG